MDQILEGFLTLGLCMEEFFFLLQESAVIAAHAQQPIPFTSDGEQRAYQLMFTRVGYGAATGYVLVPGGPVNTAAVQ